MAWELVLASAQATWALLPALVLGLVLLGLALAAVVGLVQVLERAVSRVRG